MKLLSTGNPKTLKGTKQGLAFMITFKRING